MIRSVLQVLAPDTPGVNTPGFTVGRVPTAGTTDELVSSDYGIPAELRGATLSGYNELSEVVIPAAASELLDWARRNVYELAIVGNTDIDFDNVPASPLSGRMTIALLDGPGGSTINFLPSIDWGDAGAPPSLAAGEGIVISVISVFSDLWGSWVRGFS